MNVVEPSAEKKSNKLEVICTKEVFMTFFFDKLSDYKLENIGCNTQDPYPEWDYITYTFVLPVSMIGKIKPDYYEYDEWPKVCSSLKMHIQGKSDKKNCFVMQNMGGAGDMEYSFLAALCGIDQALNEIRNEYVKNCYKNISEEYLMSLMPPCLAVKITVELNEKNISVLKNITDKQYDNEDVDYIMTKIKKCL